MKAVPSGCYICPCRRAGFARDRRLHSHRQSGRGLSVRHRVARPLQRIGHCSACGAPRPELRVGLRSVPFRRYVVFYTATGDDVRIERILHSARDIGGVMGEGADWY